MEQIAELESKALSAIASAENTTVLREIELSYLGKNGSILGLMKLIPTLSNEDRPHFGKAVNEARGRVEVAIESRQNMLKGGELEAQFAADAIDITLPSRKAQTGIEHVLQQATNKIIEVLGGMGFVYYEGPELEEFRYNFDALNYPADHPAMDEQDTFYVGDKVLRTQCTAFQGRILESVKPPLRYFTVGRTFRNEAVDRTHSHTFHQVDCFMIDRGVSMAHLKGTLELFARAMFGDEVQIRFRPDFFPFVEPGVDYAISSPKLFNGKWVELGGAGLVHPNILDAYGIDTEEFSGFAFGLGVERIPMMAYGVDDLRHFLENDIRFLEQFA